jgi:hypothetical protein
MGEIIIRQPQPGHETSVSQFTCCRCELIVVESRADDDVLGDYQCMGRGSIYCARGKYFAVNIYRSSW